MTSGLEVKGLTAGYGSVAALRNLDLAVGAGEVLALLGPNGAGKTTALLAMVGAITPMDGTISACGQDIGGWSADRVARMGVALVPDDRGVFFGLTVAEHLRLARVRESDAAREEALDRFPELRPLLGRRCGLLSGGEQQMLALAKVLVTRPKILLVDEMSLGLAPVVVQRLLPIIRQIATASETAVVIVEQHVDLALAVADLAIVLNHGAIALTGHATELRDDRAAVQAAYFGTGSGGG